VKAITICFAYYENPEMLHEQCRRLRKLPDALKKYLRLIVVDDGTGAPKAAADGALLEGISPSTVEPAKYYDIGFPFEGYRMLLDIRWNQDACRNLAVKHAQTDWVLLLDVDHIPPEQTLISLVSDQHDPRRAYRFARYILAQNEMVVPWKVAPNLWFLSQAAFWSAGGYDERLRGKYGSDRDIRDRLIDLYGVMIDLPAPLYAVGRSMVPDANTSTYTRKDKILDAGIAEIIQKRKNTPNCAPLHFRTPWERAF